MAAGADGTAPPHSCHGSRSAGRPTRPCISRSGTSFSHGIFTRCVTSWRQHLQFPLQQSWSPLLPVSPQPAHWPEPSQLPDLSKKHVTPGTRMPSQLHVYLYVVTFLAVQQTWQTGTSLQPQCGQQLPLDAHPALPQHVASSAIAAVGLALRTGHSTARRIRRFVRSAWSWLFSPIKSFE